MRVLVGGTLAVASERVNVDDRLDLVQLLRADLCLCDADVVDVLKVHPESRARFKSARETLNGSDPIGIQCDKFSWR